MTEPVLLFPGQGAQHVHMAAGLYGHEAVFTDAMDEVLTTLGAEGERIRRDWLSDTPELPIDHVCRSQILLFAIGHALGRLILSWGVRPAALLGHSVGEMAAATLAGVFDVKTATGLMQDRITRLEKAPAGGMLAVAGTQDELAPYLHGGDVAVAAVNAPRQLIIAGPAVALEETGEVLRKDGFTCRTVPSTAPFHSPALAGIAAADAPVFAEAAPRRPRIPLYSAYTATRLPAEKVADPGYWASHLTDPVLFWPALDALLTSGDYVLIEAGPSQGLAGVARRHSAVRAGRSRVLAMLPGRPSGPQADREAVRAVAAQLANGHVSAG